MPRLMLGDDYKEIHREQKCNKGHNRNAMSILNMNTTYEQDI